MSEKKYQLKINKFLGFVVSELVGGSGEQDIDCQRRRMIYFNYFSQIDLAYILNRPIFIIVQKIKQFVCAKETIQIENERVILQEKKILKSVCHL